MKTPTRHLAFFALLGLILSPLAVAHASPPPTDNVPFCAFDDYEQWRRDHPRPAAKRLANLNVGEPRTVRMIYFLPNDRPFRQEVVDLMKVRIRQVQIFFAEQMKAHGYGNWTFRFETDLQGEPMVHRVDGQHPGSYYHEPLVIRDEIRMFDLQENIYFIIVDAGFSNIGGIATRYNKKGGFAIVSASVNFTTVAHELGHAFGLGHDYRDDAYIMSYGPGQDRLSACAAEFLAVHPYFNPDSPIDETQLPTVELISPRTYPAGSESFSIRLKVGDSKGLHQVILLAATRDVFFGNAGFPEVKACRGLSGERDAVVEFEYDGSIPSSTVSSLSDPISHPIRVGVVDTEGEVNGTDFVLAAISPHHIATLEGHTDGVRAMAVSPDGGILASGASIPDGRKDTTVRLWDVASREEIATLEGHVWGATSVAFSRDGTLLAAGSSDGTILLWDVASRTKVGSLRGHRHGAWAVAFSRDGTLLASGATDFTVRLWDVANRTEIGTLKEYSSWVTSVAFSPDGALLATGSYDGAELWDVASRTKVGSLTRDGVNAVAFSLDGALLATGMFREAVKLWDVASRTEVGSLVKEHGDDVTSVAFSQDGTTLASGSVDGTVILWDVLTGKKIVAFPSTDRVRSVVFLDDDSTLASGAEDGTITLWNVSQWTGTRPHTVVKTSGDEQQGPADTQLAKPFVVSVLDEDGGAMAGVVVTFSVTAGEGLLSSTTATTDANSCTVELSTSLIFATTDANGRAATRLTLGSEIGTKGTNIVEATVAGLDPETFTAIATEQAIPHSLTKVCGDGQEGLVGEQLAEPLVISVLGEEGAAISGVVVSFAVTAGGGTLSTAMATTNANGRAATTLTLGSDAGTNTVTATVEGLASVTFTATEQEDPLASLFDALNSGKRVTLPDSPQLAQNAPNPFNSQTILAYFLPAASPARMEVFALSGQRVAVLQQGPQQAGYHRLHWDGRDDAGRPVASGMYLYRLVTDEVVLTRKLVLLR